MIFDQKSWRAPVAIGLVLCSLLPVSIATLIAALEVRGSARVYAHRIVPFIARTYDEYYTIGLVLPALTVGLAIWFVASRTLTATRFAWSLVVLVALHLLWLSYAVVAFYLANQTFH